MVIFCVRGVVSPLLSNLYLHEVLDDWFVREVQPRMKGAAQMVRYADDAVLICTGKSGHGILLTRESKHEAEAI